MFPWAFYLPPVARKCPEKKVSQRGWDWGEESEALTSDAKYKETPNNSETKIDNILMQYLKKISQLWLWIDSLFWYIKFCSNQGWD